MLRWLGGRDAIQCPVYPTAAHLHGQPVEDGLSYTTPVSLTGWPCAIVRCGTSAEGLPVGVQLVAGPWRDDIALALAASGCRLGWVGGTGPIGPGDTDQRAGSSCGGVPDAETPDPGRDYQLEVRAEERTGLHPTVDAPLAGLG